MSNALRLAALAAATALPLTAEAVTQTFTGRAAFDAAVGPQQITEDFSTFASGPVPTGAGGARLDTNLLTSNVFQTGVDIRLNRRSNDGNVRTENGEAFLRLSVENEPNNENDSLPNQTQRVTILLPYQVTFLGIDFGQIGTTNTAGEVTSGSQGIGNNSGTLINGAGLVDFDPSGLSGAIDGGVGPDQYIGFFGIVSDTAFRRITFTTNDVNPDSNEASNDDDFVVDNVTFNAVAPVPVPAGLPLMLGALGVFGWLRARRG